MTEHTGTHAKSSDRCLHERKESLQKKQVEGSNVNTRGRDWSDAAASQGIPGPTRNWKRQEGFSPRDFGGSAAMANTLI